MTRAGAGFCKAERNGNQISPKGSNQRRSTGVAELSRAEIEEADLNPEVDLVVEELEGGDARIRERKEDETVVKINTDSLANPHLSKFFTDTEIAELEKKEQVVTGEDGPSDYDEAMEEIRKDVERHNKEVARNKKELEKKRIRDAYRDPALDKMFKNMKGEEIQRVMSGSDDSDTHIDEEELQSALNEVDKKYASLLEDSEPVLEDPSTEIEELDEGLQAWKDSKKEYWHEFARDLEKSDETTMYESVGPNSKRVTTQEEELKQALRDPENEPNWTGTVELEEDTGETVIAVVREDWE